MNTTTQNSWDHSGVIVIRSMSSIEEQPLAWLWKNYIPAGMLTLLAGAGGSGKSTLAFDFAATLSLGGVWPDGSRAEVGNTLIWSSEDSAEHTIKPRLMAAGANPDRIAMIDKSADDCGSLTGFDPAKDIDSLVWHLRDCRARGLEVRLLIIDPIVCAVAGDMHRANDVRRSLQPLADLASEFGCAVLGITHHAKNTAGNNPSERVIGSQAFSALARMVLATAKEEDSDRCVFTRAKSNISETGGGYEYVLEEVKVKPEIDAMRIVWGEAVSGSARALLSDAEREVVPVAGRKAREAKAFLTAFLAQGPKPQKEVAERAMSQGIAWITLRRAASALGVKQEKAKGSMTGPSMWSISE